MKLDEGSIAQNDMVIRKIRREELQSLVDEYGTVSASVMSGFIRCGEILTEISTKKLYESCGCKSMGVFLKEQWGMEHRRANQLMAASDAYSKLNMGQLSFLPQNEGQMRELLKVPAVKRDKVWAECIDLSEFERAMKQAQEEITHGMYYTECPHGVGAESCANDCDLCNGCGWIVRGTYNRLSDEDRECLN